MSQATMFDLFGRVALVTGGGSGIGRSMCEALAENGADVAVADLNEDSARETVEILSKYGHRALAIQADVSKATEVDHMVREVVAKFGRLDIACNNAGALVGKYLIHETPEEVWDTIMAVNFKGVFLCTKAEVEVMLRQAKGSIINTSSVGALIPGDAEMMGSIYNSAKAGVICFSRMAAGEYGKDGIRVNAIAPGMIMGTAFAAERRKSAPPPPPEKVAATLTKIALRRPGKADDLKGIVVYLASDASSYATGQVFVVDGGLT
jgi:NAD(P)-dependent dehydrogenase (short-subunit alcohol dehydrogenase family)